MSYLGRKGATAPLSSTDIPDNSITSAKIVDGAVTGSDITFPSGHCIQMVHEQNYSPSTISHSDASWQNSGVDIEITPKYDNSKILLMFQSGASASTSGNENHITIYRDSTDLGAGAYGLANANTSMRPASLLWVDTPGTSGSAIEYSIYYRSGSSGTAAYLIWGGSSWSFIAMEIKV